MEGINERNKLVNFKNGTIRIVPKEGPPPRHKDRTLIGEDEFKRACWTCRERKICTEYYAWAKVCQEGSQGLKERTIAAIIKKGERRYCSKCWEDVLEKHNIEYRKNGDIRLITKEEEPKEAENKGNKRIKVDDIERKKVEGKGKKKGQL